MIHPETFQLSKHAITRRLKRGLSDLQIALAMDFGQRVHGTGAEICFLGRRDIPDWIHPRYAARVEGTVVVLADDGTVVTAYRNPDAMRDLRKLEGRPREPRVGSSCH